MVLVRSFTVVRQFLAKAQLIRPEIISNVINSSGMLNIIRMMNRMVYSI